MPTSKASLINWGKSVAKKNGLAIEELIDKAKTGAGGQLRNTIWRGRYRKKLAVLKVYDDYRVTDEARSLRAFHRHNRSQRLTAPKLFAAGTESAKRGWLIMEHVPPGSSSFHSPMSSADRRKFLGLFLEYRKYFPRRPTRPLGLAEHLGPAEFHVFRIGRWLQLASDAEAERRVTGKKPLLHGSKFARLYESGLTIIRQEFRDRIMVWCHGHFKPKELFRPPTEGPYYLTDFAHTKLYPEGYELDFMIWADYLLGADWRQPYPQWRLGLQDWITDFQPVLQTLKFRRPGPLLRASLIERTLGTIMADVVAHHAMPEDEKVGRLRLLLPWLRELIRQPLAV